MKPVKKQSLAKQTTTTLVLLLCGVVDILVEGIDQLLPLMNLDEEKANYYRIGILILVMLREKIGNKLKRVFAVQIRWVKAKYDNL